MELLWIDLTLSGLWGNFGTYQTIKKLTQKILTYYFFENVKEQKRDNEMPKGTRLGKTEQDIAFR